MNQNPFNNSTSISLVSRARKGEDDAWRQLMRIYGPAIKAKLRRKGLKEHDAEDVLSDILTRVLRNFENFRREPPKLLFRRWLTTICNTALLDHWKRTAKYERPIGGSNAVTMAHEIPDPIVDEQFDDDAFSESDSEFQIIVREALLVLKGNFEDHVWQAFWLTTVEDKNSTEVGEILSMKPGAVRAAKKRVTDRLREFLDFE